MSMYTRIIDLQNLREAWKRVRKNKPAAGVDHVTCEQFEEHADLLIRELQIELANQSYEVLPVKQVVLYKGEKAREIALYCMRDKVVQQSIAIILNKMFDSRFSASTYAYRSDQSALNAVQEIHDHILEGKYHYALKMDITHFFDEICWPVLKGKLDRFIEEEDVMKLIKDNCCSVMLDEVTGELVEKNRGIYQGSALSPVLSNVYMMEFDHWLREKISFYARYADDILILGEDAEPLRELLTECALQLQTLGLRLNESKTMIVSLEDGVDFLGYHFDSTGKSIPKKAEESLQNRLETMWLTSADIGFDDKIRKVMEIAGGWEQYFREDREITSILEYTALMAVAGNHSERMGELRILRPKIVNVYKDIMQYLSGIWMQQGEDDLELLEYEQFYQVPDAVTIQPKDDQNTAELLGDYRQYVVLESEDLAVEIMQCYTDLHRYEAASFWLDVKDRMEDTQKAFVQETIPIADTNSDIPIYNGDTPSKLLKLFAGREDVYARETLGYDRKRQVNLITVPLTTKQIKEHLSGTMTLGTYIQRPNSTVHFMVVDVDISRKLLLQFAEQEEKLSAYLAKALQKAIEVCKILGNMGLKGYIEFSGNRGYHVWVFLTEWMPVRYANMFFEIMETKLQPDEDIAVEYFPNKTRVKPGKFGQPVKVPFGIHVKSGKRSYFLNEDQSQVKDINPFIDSVARFSIGAVKKVLAMNTGIRESTEKTVVDEDLSAFTGASDSSLQVLQNCNLMRYLCQKSVKTGYLNHFERLTILYVFGHLGEDGKKFVHQVMSFTLNYNYNVTEKFILKCPEKPISCLKLQDQYKKITAEIGCNCLFKRKKNCYPSPVLHAIQYVNVEESDITLPTSRTLTKEKEQQVLDEMNIHKKAQELAKRILELKKQKRGIDRNIRDIVRELSEIFDNEKIDSLEMEMGLLVRRKKEQGYEWLIEL